ncbi:MAG: dihydropteroate synthase [Gammaproteobacteria bacterium]|nr:dihydropteroate synthase [Gammaproteobacteria bacterium]
MQRLDSPHRATSLRLGKHYIDLSTPRVMGILNATPDSFSDGGRLQSVTQTGGFRVSVDRALQLAEIMLGQGASIIDVGGESTRPGALPVSEQEEMERVLPVIEAIATRLDIAISVDTSSAGVMQHAIAVGAGLINDVRALGRQGAMEAVAPSTTVVCLMHMRGQPLNMQEQAEYGSVVDEVLAFLEQRIVACEKAGIERGRLLVDPGFGFGKTLTHNYELLRHLERLQVLGLPILVGLSRKSMIGNVTGKGVEQRLAGGLAATVHALLKGAAIIRTHDVAETVDAIKVHCAVMRD